MKTLRGVSIAALTLAALGVARAQDASTHAADPHAEKLQLLVTLFVMFAAAKIFAEIFERMRQPAVVGEILAGVLIGPSLLGWVSPSLTTDTLSEIGVILLMFAVGLETEPRAILAVGRTAFLVAVIGVVLPFAFGFAAILAFAGSLQLSQPTVVAAFIGATTVATSVGITARVLADMDVLSHQAARVILAAAVIDDVLALLALSVVSGLASPTGVHWGKVGLTALLAIAFVGFVAFVGTRVIKRVAPRVERLRTRDSLLVFALALCLGLALLSEYIGIAAIIGAFLAGMMLADRSDHDHLLHKAEALVQLFLPFFLAGIGMQLSLAALADMRVLTVAVVITLLAVLGKYLAGVLAARGLGKRVAAQVGMGMVPRGEVGIVAAQIGRSLNVLDDRTFAIALFMAVATTLVAPPFLRRLFAPEMAERRSLVPVTGTPDAGRIVEDDPLRVE
jgi:Kef-type K+ transport system membrane component KefB